MSMTMPPSDPTTSPTGPDRLNIEPRELQVTGVYDNGAQHNMYLVENSDLSVILRRGPRTAEPSKFPGTWRPVTSSLPWASTTTTTRCTTTDAAAATWTRTTSRAGDWNASRVP